MRGKTEQDLAKEIRTLLGGNGPEVSIECTGVASSIETAIWVCFCILGRFLQKNVNALILSPNMKTNKESTYLKIME